ncbi:hypothetical protein [Paenibacillus eucommiae]|uniref:Uncharacterized protein n=1 Tax=Paenibacillus eucommiae TaxID=1355755 RepID=A0ABS4IRM0_9BACL|nr:hypothetical protein [Paenibacillus eucommiae]MBP1990178.1 hypothetical protein [Paenibacillus eucommiae]
MSKKQWFFTFFTILVIIMTSGCGNSASTGTDTSPTSEETPSQTPVTTDSGTKPKNEEVPQTTEATSPAPTASDSGKVPDELPSDFPLPKDAEITTAQSQENDGKKSVLLIYSTHEDMSTVTKMYKDYFKSQNLEDTGQVIDDKNLIIQGKNKEAGQSWSMIGGPLASQEGVIELTVTWNEI